MRTKRLERNIRLLYIQAILRSAIFIAPILVPLMQSRGLSFLKIMLLQSIFAFASMLFEIPSGYFSDKLGRKKTIVIASISLTFGNILFYLAHSFWQFVAMELTFAFAYSMLSGTVSALLYETLLELNRENEYSKLWGDIGFYSLISVAGASLIGGVLAKISLNLPLLLVTVPFGISTIFALMLIEPNVAKKQNKHGVREDFKEIGRFLKSNMHITLIIVLSAVIFWFNQSAFWLYQPYFKESGIDIAYYGLIFASLQIVAAVASKYAYWAIKKFGLKRVIIIVSIISPISIFLMGLNITTLGFIFMYAQQITRSFKGVAISQIMQESVKSHFRATVDSIANFIAKLGFAAILPIIGYAMDKGTLSNTLIYLGVVGFILVLIPLIMLLQRVNSFTKT